MTGLRLTLAGKYLPIFEKYPLPWRCEYVTAFAAGMRASYFVDGTRMSDDVVFKLWDASGRLIATTASHTPELCYRLWDMYSYVLHAADWASVPRVIQLYPLPWWCERWAGHLSYNDMTSVRDANNNGVMSWWNKQADSSLHSALFDFSVYAYDILRRSQQ